MFATFLASAAVIGFLSLNIRKYRSRKGEKIMEAVPVCKIDSYKSAFAAGVVTSNGLFHFLHGILGYDEFPAPFAKVFGRGIPTDISNIVWGFFNLAVAYVLIIRCKKSDTKWTFILLFISGTVIMALLLRFVLLSRYFKTHPF